MSIVNGEIVKIDKVIGGERNSALKVRLASATSHGAPIRFLRNEGRAAQIPLDAVVVSTKLASLAALHKSELRGPISLH
jgi:hypothetical protein